MTRPAPRFKDALDVLARHGVDFIVVGGVADVVERQIGDHRVRTLGLASLIRTKELAGRDQDLAVLAILRRTLEESTK